MGTALLTARGRRVGWEEKTAGGLGWLPAVPREAEQRLLRRGHQRLARQSGERSGSRLAPSPTHLPPERPSPLGSCPSPSGGVGGDAGGKAGTRGWVRPR